MPSNYKPTKRLQHCLLLGAVITICWGLGGCSNEEQALMPLSEGAEWTYIVRSDFQSSVITQRVDEPRPVGSRSGWLLTGDMGSSHLAWHGSSLLAERLGDTSFKPPIVILARPDQDEPTTWEGEIVTLAIGDTDPVRATAKLEVATVNDFELEGRKIEAVKAQLKISSNGVEIEILTWYGQGIGILRQEQRRDGRLQLSLEYLSGP